MPAADGRLRAQASCKRRKKMGPGQAGLRCILQSRAHPFTQGQSRPCSSSPCSAFCSSRNSDTACAPQDVETFFELYIIVTDACVRHALLMGVAVIVMDAVGAHWLRLS